MSGWQLSGDAPTFYTRYAYAMQEPWTSDLILQARCKDGDRVLDVACGPGLVAGESIRSAMQPARSPELTSMRPCSMPQERSRI